MIHFQNNFLSSDLYQKVESYCYRADYYYGETDNENEIPTGLVHNFELDNEIVSYFPTKLRDLSLYKAYINLFYPGEKPNFHIDGVDGPIDKDRLTALFYINDKNYDLNEGGCTEILTHDNYFISVRPIQNTLATFDAQLLHRATSFKTLPRFTIALKYS